MRILVTGITGFVGVTIQTRGWVWGTRDSLGENAPGYPGLLERGIVALPMEGVNGNKIITEVTNV